MYLSLGRSPSERRFRPPVAGLSRMLSRALSHLDLKGKIRWWFGATSSVTARHAEEALRESEARFRHLADSAPVLIWMTDAEPRVVFANKHCERIFGQPAEMLGDTWMSVILEEDIEPFGKVFRGAFQARRPFEAEVRVRDRTGRVRWLRCEGVPRLDDAGRFLGYTGCSLDITEARLAAEELERRIEERTAELLAAEDTLRQAQKMEALGQLTGGIAHDFNNMLQGITSGVEMAERRVASGRTGDAQRFLESARNGLDRAAGLTRRLLAFARRQPLEPKPLDPDVCVAGMADLIRRIVGPAVQLELHLRDGVARVLCDPHELESALLNLCINARDAMPDGGLLTITTHNIQLSAKDTGARDRAEPAPYVAIAVADTGHGMSPDVEKRAFDPFFTTKPEGQGTGLGLSQVVGFVRQSGGVVQLESVVGRGTIVRICLPWHDPAEFPDQPIETPAPESGTGAGRRVLLVDDEHDVRAVAAEWLRERGYNVLEAIDGAAALNLIEREANIDLLVTDLGLPGGFNGRQLADAMRARLPGLRVLFITGYAGTTLPEGSDVMMKPFKLDRLARRIEAILGRA